LRNEDEAHHHTHSVWVAKAQESAEEDHEKNGGSESPFPTAVSSSAGASRESIIPMADLGSKEHEKNFSKHQTTGLR